MANFVTYSQIETKIFTDLDLLDELFITGGVGSEMMGHCNEAIHIAESLIMSLCEDYFETVAAIPIVSGTSDYDFPADCYGDKIRKLVYSNGTLIYPIRKIWRSNGEEEMAYITAAATGILKYKHKIINDATLGRKIRFFPPAFETSPTFVQCWYIRSAKKVSTLTDVIDIPEFHSFIEKYMKMMSYEKEGHPNYALSKQAYDEEKQLMINSLSEREPDTDTTIEQDFSFYSEHT